MEDYEVIEHIKEKSKDIKKFEVVALNYKEPSYAKIESEEDVKDNTIIQVDVDSRKVFLNGREIGKLVSLRTGKDIKIDTNYDIKYTGGYSIDGKKVYLDEHFPKILHIDGKDVDTRESIGRRHELVEKWLIDDAYEYPYAHMIATRIEREYVESLGVSWDHYCEEVDRNLRETYKLKVEKSPESLDLTPYVYSRDREALKEIRESEKI